MLATRLPSIRFCNLWPQNHIICRRSQVHSYTNFEQFEIIRFWVIKNKQTFIIVITGSVLFSLKCTKKRLAAGLCPDPLGELERSHRPPSRIRGWAPRKGGEGREWRAKEKGKEERGGEGKGKKSSFPPMFTSRWRHCAWPTYTDLVL